MTGPDEPNPKTTTAPRPCLVDGCPCKDARVVSTRRAAFYGARALANGETARRVIAVEPGWKLPAEATS
jgi:hypothetical protein